ncbi:AtzH-like domain-containing protein [Marisediminicola sp. LYQ134]|uniref:AtzH-like domain-containing protein n=1 Tax=Marisediminicola sp. LYQ134 TaxID=3391061 RepID=UPI003983C2F2
MTADTGISTAPHGLMDAVRAYEAALMADDVARLDAFFEPGSETLRGDASGLLVGHERIAGFRRSRGGTPARSIVETHVRTLTPESAVVVTVSEAHGGGRGQQTQLWRRSESGWAIAVAHVTAPAPAIDRRVWRTVGTPLVRGSATGSLARLRVAVKDLFAVAGHPIGAGVPAYLDGAAVESGTAPAVVALLEAGADVSGIAQTDEFAYSIAGRNPHYGTPPNPAVVGGIPGGSSNGPASAVALGHADIGLGTDTGGSLRVPASYSGLWGIRTTHGAIDRSGLLPLAESFDTVGWLTRDLETLMLAARATLGDVAAREATSAPRVSRTLAVSPALLALADPASRAGVAAVIDAWTAAGITVDEIDVPDVDGMFEAFRTVQGIEAWRTHGAWIADHPRALGAEISARFAWASRFSSADEVRGRDDVASYRAELDERLAGRTLVLPSASSAAPLASATPDENEVTRAGTLRLTCVAGILGAPAVSMPLVETESGPVGVCVVGPRSSDLDLLEFARELADLAR